MNNLQQDAQAIQRNLRKEIAGIAEIYGYRNFENRTFTPGTSYIPVSGKVIGGRELKLLTEAVLDGWWTEGEFVDRFEKGLAKATGRRFTSMVNSGSSANLLALATLKEAYGIPDGAEVITTAVSFPTTVNPILQLGLKPRLIDVELGTYVPTLDMIAEAINERTAGIMIAHTLGNPWPISDVQALDILRTRRIFIIEDNCDALGSLLEGVYTGSLGNIGTQSFYPAHHITTGEGGALTFDSPRLRKIAESYRDWGRDCWCDPGKENTCGKRFDQQFEGLPAGYDHKYVYSRIGWNLKSTDLNAAIGLAQLERLPGFIEARRRNFNRLIDGFVDREIDRFFILPEPSPNSLPSWFGFPLTLRPNAPWATSTVTRHLEERCKIGTRRLFAGFLPNQPAYQKIHMEQQDLSNSFIVGHYTFWIGVWPGLDDPVIDYMIESFANMIESWEDGE